MSPASRQTLGQAAAGLTAHERPNRRVATLQRRLAGTPRQAASLAELAAAPAWLQLPAPARQAIAQRAALLGIAPALARSIDGAWLAGFTRLVGDAAVDSAIAAAATQPMRVRSFAASELPVAAASLLRAAVRAELRDYAAPAPAMPMQVEPDAAREAVELALQAPA